MGRSKPVPAENQSEVLGAQLKGRIRKREMPLAELTQDARRLARKAYPFATSEVRERLALVGFIDSLCDPNL